MGKLNLSKEKGSRRRRKTGKSLFALLALIAALAFTPLFSPQSATAQSSPITVSVNRSEFSTDELVVLTVTVVDDSALQPRPILPSLDGLAVIDMDIATDVSVVNGKIQTQVIYTYRLQARRTGLLIIPPVTVEIGGRTFKAAPISIKVEQGAPPVPSSGNAVQPTDITPPEELAGQDLFVESQVDNPTPYVGEQIIHTFRFYQAIQLYRPPQFESPLFTGFETLGMPVQEYNLEIDGRTYLITEIRTALFAATPGRITITTARLMFPGNIHEDPVELETEPLAVDVQELPPGAPAGFEGAIGRYQVQTWFSPQVAIVNQPSSFFISVTGTGNIQTLPEPVWEGMRGWRTYDSLTSLTTDMENGLMSGTRVYERLVVPDGVGEFSLPPATLVYFDPGAEEYRTATSQPVSVKVIPPPTPDPAAVTATAMAPAATATPASAAAAADTSTANDRPVNPVLPDSALTDFKVPLPFFIIVLLVTCGAVPLAAAVGASGVWLWQRQKARAAEKEQALLQPRESLHPVLAKAMKEKAGNNYSICNQAIYSYLSDALGKPVKGLTRTELSNHLRRRGLNETLVRQVNECLTESEVGLYGAATPNTDWTLMEATEKLLFKLDEAFRNEDEASAR